MIGIFISFVVAGIGFICIRKFNKAKWATVLFFAGFNILLLEIIIYGYFFYLISAGKVFFLVDQQLVLDKLIRSSLTQSLYEKDNTHNQFYQIDDRLGYTVGKNKEFVQYQSTSQGLRADQLYAKEPDRDIFRMAAFGDSFVFCDGEYLQHTWPYLLEKSTNRMQVLNFGVSGYGMGQSYMRYMLEGKDFDSDVVFFNYITLGNRDRIDPQELVANESLKSSTAYRIQFWLEDGQLQHKAFTPFDLFDAEVRWKYVYAPLKADAQKFQKWEEMGRYSNLGLFVKRILLRSELKNRTVKFENQDEVSLALLKNLLKTVKRHNGTLFFFHGRPFEGLPQIIQDWILENIADILYVDSNDIMGQRLAIFGDEVHKLYNPTSHYNWLGNKIYAETIAYILISRLWGGDKRIFGYSPNIQGFLNVALDEG